MLTHHDGQPRYAANFLQLLADNMNFFAMMIPWWTFKSGGWRPRTDFTMLACAVQFTAAIIWGVQRDLSCILSCNGGALVWYCFSSFVMRCDILGGMIQVEAHPCCYHQDSSMNSEEDRRWYWSWMMQGLWPYLTYWHHGSMLGHVSCAGNLFRLRRWWWA